MQPLELKTLNEEVDQNPGLLLYFFSNHCAPCISLRPKVQEMVASDFSKLKMILIDSEVHPDITAHYGVFANPTLMVFFEGREFQRWSKFVSVSQIAEAIERPYSLLFEE
ncbi:MAG: thioredoxin family protein [Bacteroidales bacterium]|jgi:thioredoxin-like negative regulator of GroEL|nr:thioredoxin family protein [Bacteroidales bacterium]